MENGYIIQQETAKKNSKDKTKMGLNVPTNVPKRDSIKWKILFNRIVFQIYDSLGHHHPTSTYSSFMFRMTNNKQSIELEGTKKQQY